MSEASKINAVYRLSWTWNKPTDIEEDTFKEKVQLIETTLEQKFPKCKYIYQLERGAANGLLHYQGHLKLDTKERPLAVAEKLRPDMQGIHVSPDSTVGSTNAEFYCMKKDITYVLGPWADKDFIMPDYSNLTEPNGWQIPLRDILLGPWQERIIYWVYETTGNTGKSNFATYMEIHHKIIGLGLGTANDNFYAVSEMPARGYIFDVPRTRPQRWDWAEIYMSLEKIKDRNFLSTKYKPKKVILPIIPHLIVFSNEPPDRKCLSDDRWKVFKIIDNALVEMHAIN